MEYLKINLAGLERRHRDMVKNRLRYIQLGSVHGDDSICVHEPRDIVTHILRQLRVIDLVTIEVMLPNEKTRFGGPTIYKAFIEEFRVEPIQ